MSIRGQRRFEQAGSSESRANAFCQENRYTSPNRTTRQAAKKGETVFRPPAKHCLTPSASHVARRRTKQQVVQELPPKTEILREVPLANDQRDLYETLRLVRLTRLGCDVSWVKA